MVNQIAQRTTDITAGCLLAWLLTAMPVFAEEPVEPLPLVDDTHSVSDAVLEAFLSPGEFPARRFVYVIDGEAASFALDASLGADKPFATLNGDRVTWPDIAGLALSVETTALSLTPSSEDVNDDALDRGFSVRWVLKPLGQRFSPEPHFAAQVVAAEVVSADGKQRLLHWRRDAAPPVCTARPEKGRPNCEVASIGLEARAVSLSPSGKLLAVAFSGIRPRIEIYNVAEAPKLVWQAVFPKASGGVLTAAFSADEKWVAALTGQGKMHRFDAFTGERHLSIPSSGRSATAIAEKRIMGVAGKSGEVRFWYLDDGTIAWQLPPRRDKGAVDRLVVSGDGGRFATLEYNAQHTVIRVWEWKRRSVVAEFETDPLSVYDIAMDETGDTLYWSHEEKGLYVVKVKRGATPRLLKNRNAKQCQRGLQWISGDNTLSCSIAKGELRLDRKGRLKRKLTAPGDASEWIVSASSSGSRLAAVGGGRLLVWWTR